ncbi:MAG: nucleoside 2-deoxyribosyltransferase [Myxococcota bacterium]
MPTSRVYLAGPDVFLPDAVAQGERKKQICRAHGLDGRYPLDVAALPPGLAPRAQARALFDAMIGLMDSCDAGIANLTPFRGPSMDVGTAVEIGYLHARGKRVFGYTNDPRDYARRVSADGLLIEEFGLCDNLMIEGVIARVVRAAAPPENVLGALDSFERCVREAAAELLVR